MPSIKKIHILKAGMLTTLQDRGRSGHQHLGVPVGGAMDQYAAGIANQLVGNIVAEPLLEITLLGPKIRFEGAGTIAICGGDLSPMVDQVSVPMWEAITIQDGAILSFGKVRSGCRAYLAIRGQWKVDKWLGSCSPIATFGEAIQKNDTIEIGISQDSEPLDPLIIKIPSFTSHWEIELMPGPEFEQFSRFEIAWFFSQKHQISNQSNRMGYRLQKAIPGFNPSIELLSSAVLPGTIQITRSGHPILLMRDAQTTGGYPRLAILPETQINKMAQAKPGDFISFHIIKK